MSARDDAYSKRRKREKALAVWRREVRAKVTEMRAELGLTPDDRTEMRLAEEIVLLAHPDAVPGLDAVIPAARLDLVEEWVTVQLAGNADTLEQRLALARRLAPLPNEHLTPYHDREKGSTRYRSDVRVEAVARAVRSYVDSRRRRDPEGWKSVSPWPNLS